MPNTVFFYQHIDLVHLAYGPVHSVLYELSVTPTACSHPPATWSLKTPAGTGRSTIGIITYVPDGFVSSLSSILIIPSYNTSPVASCVALKCRPAAVYGFCIIVGDARYKAVCDAASTGIGLLPSTILFI